MSKLALTLGMALAIVTIAMSVTPLAVSADNHTSDMFLDLPPGIAAQAQPLLDEMMERMRQMPIPPEQMQKMMADMQNMAEILPPGIFLELLRLMPQLDMDDMMALHLEIQNSGLLQKPPGQVLLFVRELASA